MSQDCFGRNTPQMKKGSFRKAFQFSSIYISDSKGRVFSGRKVIQAKINNFLCYLPKRHFRLNIQMPATGARKLKRVPKLLIGMHFIWFRDGGLTTRKHPTSVEIHSGIERENHMATSKPSLFRENR